eukprot:169620_1
MNPTINPTNIPTNPSKTTSHPTNPSIYPTFDPTIGPSHPTVNPTISSTIESTIISLSTTQDENEQLQTTLHISKSLLSLVIVIGMLVGIIIIICIIYLVFISKITERTKQIGTATVLETLNEFSWIERLSLGIEVIDIITDYLYGVDLITHNLASLGWISLFAAGVGCVIFYIKFFLAKKLIGFQSVQLKAEFKQNVDNAEKCLLLMNQLRQRKMDIYMISLLIACFEDCPQSIIVVIVVTSDIGWSSLSVLTMSLAIMSFGIKICQVMMSKCGCKDPEVDGQQN